MMPEPIIDESVNVFGEPLELCGTDPMTGFFRDGCCNTCDEDAGSHTVCIEASDDFLEYSRLAGNDLSTPSPAMGFPGLQAGDRWCLCAGRWLQAYEQGHAPKLFLTRTHIKALEIVPLELMKKHAVDIN